MEDRVDQLERVHQQVMERLAEIFQLVSTQDRRKSHLEESESSHRGLNGSCSGEESPQA
jgi:hypothetical protein